MQSAAQRLSIFKTKLSARAPLQYPDLCTFQRPTITTDSVGGKIGQFADTSLAPIPCRLTAIPKRDPEMVVADVPQSSTIYELVCPGTFGAPVDVDGTCRVVIAARDDDPERILNVTGINRGSDLELKVRCSVTEPQAA